MRAQLNFRRIGFTGAIVAIVLVYLAAVGLIEQLSKVYALGPSITIAQVFLVVPVVLAGWLATRPRVEGGARQSLTTLDGTLTGAATGLVTGVVVALITAAVSAFGPDRIRPVFVSVTPKLITQMGFDHGPGAGFVIWVVLGSILGAIGAALRSLSKDARFVVLTGPITIIALGLLQRVISTGIKELGSDPRWLYDTKTGGPTWGGAIGVAVVAVLAVVARDVVRSRTDLLGPNPAPGAAGMPGVSKQAMTSRRAVKLATILVVLLALPWVIGSALSSTVGTVLIFTLLGLGLNIVVGYAGLLDLGYVAFFAFGAYATALLTGAQVNTSDGAAPPAFGLHLNFYLALPIVVLLAAGVGLMIGAPVLRLRGDYLAIVTLGLGEVMSTLVTSKWASGLVGGPQGMRDVTGANFGTLTNFQSNTRQFYYLALAFVALAVYTSWRLQSSRVGRAWNAMREDEQVADAMGISITRYKLLAFATGGAVGSIGGALLAVQLGSLAPNSFDLNVSILALAVVILGGMGSIRGVVLGAFALVGLPGFLREFESFRPLALGAVIIAIMLLRPQGILPSARRSDDIADEDRAQDAWARSAAGTAGAAAGAVVGSGSNAGIAPEPAVEA